MQVVGRCLRTEYRAIHHSGSMMVHTIAPKKSHLPSGVRTVSVFLQLGEHSHHQGWGLLSLTLCAPTDVYPFFLHGRVVENLSSIGEHSHRDHSLLTLCVAPHPKVISAQEEEEAGDGAESIETQGMNALAQLPHHQQVRRVHPRGLQDFFFFRTVFRSIGLFKSAFLPVDLSPFVWLLARNLCVLWHTHHAFMLKGILLSISLNTHPVVNVCATLNCGHARRTLNDG